MRSKICWLGPLLGTVVLGFVFTPAARAAEPAPDPALIERAKRILREVPLVDGHNDLPWEYRQRVKNQLGKIDLTADLSRLKKPMHTDIPRLRQGGVGAQFWSVYIAAQTMQGATAVQTVLEQIDVVHRLDRALPGRLRARPHRRRRRAHPQSRARSPR